MAFGDGVMGMQAFRMDDPYGEPARLWIALQGAVQPAHRVLAEHQVLPVGEGEGLLVGAFHRSLHRGAEGAFAEIRQLFQGQSDAVFRQADAQVRAAALAVRGGDDAGAAAEPRKHAGMIERLSGEVLVEALLDQLPGQCRRTGAG